MSILLCVIIEPIIKIRNAMFHSVAYICFTYPLNLSCVSNKRLGQLLIYGLIKTSVMGL